MSRNEYQELKVSGIKKETDNSSVVSLQVPDHLKDEYKFIPGQYLNFKIQLNGEEYRRSYSICSNPEDQDLRIGVKKMEDGTISRFLNDDLKEGQSLLVAPPQGHFVVDSNMSNGKYMFFAAGSGITPIISMVTNLLRHEEGSTVQLHYGNKDESNIMFRSDLEELVRIYPERFELINYLSKISPGEPFKEGRIAINSIDFEPLGFNVSSCDSFYLCGPETMINEMSDHLISLGIDKEKIHYELFTTGVEETKPEQQVQPQTDQVLTGCEVEITLDDEITNLKIDTAGPTVLESAIAAGIDPPYSCRGGVCTTCMARLKEGRVKMDMNHALTDTELEEGYILTCQSHPTTATVKINYDDI